MRAVKRLIVSLHDVL